MQCIICIIFFGLYYMHYSYFTSKLVDTDRQADQPIAAKNNMRTKSKLPLGTARGLSI